jgi:hypothetical protein
VESFNKWAFNTRGHLGDVQELNDINLLLIYRIKSYSAVQILVKQASCQPKRTTDNQDERRRAAAKRRHDT